MSERDRIRWHCRRGLLELDLVLAAFLERHFDRLDAREVELFKALLEQPDNDLVDLVMGRAEPEPKFGAIVERLRESCAAPMSI